MHLGSVIGGAAAFILLLSPTSPVHAQTPAQFYKGKNVDFYIGYSVGGAYDLYARTIARHLGKHIPGNPAIVPKNMEGAGSLRLANWLYNVAPKDGTAIATIGRGTGFDPLLGSKGAQFKADQFTWIGSANNEVSVCVAWKNSGFNKLEDVMAKELIVGGTGQAADTDQFPRILNGVLGTKFKIVTGYPGGNDVTLAMERGEVKGRCGWSWSSVLSTHKRWVDDKSINILVQLSLDKHPDLPERPAGDGVRQDRRAEAHFSADLRPAGDGTALSRAARRAEGPRRRATRSIRRHHEGSGILGGCHQGTTRNHAGVGRRCRETGARTLSDTEGYRRQGRRIHPALVRYGADGRTTGSSGPPLLLRERVGGEGTSRQVPQLRQVHSKRKAGSRCKKKPGARSIPTPTIAAGSPTSSST